MDRKGYTLVELMVVIFFVLVVLAVIPLLGLWTDRNLDFWLTHLKGHVVNVPYWLSLILSLLLNAGIIAANIIAEIARFAL